jgi:uncharacterized protein YbjT (DUF2867 family)
MTSPILVTGGTGTLGRLVVRRLRDAGCDVRVLSRRSRAAEDDIEFVTGDLATGAGIEPAVEGTEIIVHCAGTPKGNENETRNLVRAASRARARHLVYISVVGADRVPIAPAGSTAPSSATSPPSWPPNGSWPTPACRSRRCAPPSFTS